MTPAEGAPPLGRHELVGRVLGVLERGSWRDPDVLLVEGPDGPIVVKDFAPRARWLRRTLGRFLTHREAMAYAELDGHPAVPRFFGRIDAHAIAIEYRPGTRISRQLADRVAPDFLDTLEASVRALHARGVVHLDLRHRSNVLVDEKGQPVLIDFASALRFRAGGLAARWLLPVLARVDLRAVEKWRARLEPGMALQQSAVQAADAAPAARGYGSGRGASRPT